jgi:hypothetical protein
LIEITEQAAVRLEQGEGVPCRLREDAHWWEGCFPNYQVQPDEQGKIIHIFNGLFLVHWTEAKYVGWIRPAAVTLEEPCLTPS